MGNRMNERNEFVGQRHKLEINFGQKPRAIITEPNENNHNIYII